MDDVSDVSRGTPMTKRKPPIFMYPKKRIKHFWTPKQWSKDVKNHQESHLRPFLDCLDLETSV